MRMCLRLFAIRGSCLHLSPARLRRPLNLCLDCVTADSYPVAETVEAAKVDYGGNDAKTSGNIRARRGGCFGFVNVSGQEIGFDCRSAARKSHFSVACSDRNQGLRLCCPAGDAVSE